VVAVTDAPIIRSAGLSDVNIILDLWHLAGAEPSVTDVHDSISNLIRRQPDGLLLAEVDGATVGSLVAVNDGWRGNMYRLTVLPPYRRRGIARALVEEGERRLHEQGCTRITALVMHEHDWATEFWSAVGYAHDERVLRFVRTLP
jgi:ribosomal protein S18 acetylase RimI-like enzyme